MENHIITSQAPETKQFGGKAQVPDSYCSQELYLCIYVSSTLLSSNPLWLLDLVAVFESPCESPVGRS